MNAIFEAFADQQIACNSIPVVNSGCANVPVAPPVITEATAGDMQVKLSWATVSNANHFDVMRAEGSCTGAKVKINRNSETALSITDTGLKNGFEVSVTSKKFLEEDIL